MPEGLSGGGMIAFGIDPDISQFKWNYKQTCKMIYTISGNLKIIAQGGVVQSRVKLTQG